MALSLVTAFPEISVYLGETALLNSVTEIVKKLFN